jgi:tetratricopeptide (TPR) repeat protein
MSDRQYPYPLVIRQKEIDHFNATIEDSKTNCILILGRAGIGKTCLISSLLNTSDLSRSIVSIKIKRSDSENVELVLGNLIFELKKIIDGPSEWKVSKEKIVSAVETTLQTVKFIFKIPEGLPLEKLPSFIAGIEKNDYKMGIIHEFKNFIQKFNEFIPDNQKLIIVIDQIERLNRSDLALLFDVIEDLPDRVVIILASQDEILSSDIIGKVNPDIIPVSLFSIEETRELLQKNDLPYDDTFVNKFHDKYLGYPLLENMAVTELKSSHNFDLDRLPAQLDYYFKSLVSEVNPGDLSFIWILSIFRECVKLDDIARLMDKTQEEILVLSRKKEIMRIIEINHCFELFHPLFSEYVSKELEANSRERYRQYHEVAATFYINILEEIDKNTFNSFISAIIETPYHAMRADMKTINPLILSALKMKASFGYPKEVVIELNWLSKKYEALKDFNGELLTQSILGQYYMIQGNYQLAKTSIERSLRIAKNNQNKYQICSLLNNLAIIFTKTNDMKKSLKLFRKALKIASDMNDNRRVFKILISASEAYNQINQHHSALSLLLRAEGYEDLIDSNIEKVTFRNNLAKTYAKLDEPGKGIENIQKAIDFANKCYCPIEWGHVLNNLGFLQKNQGNFSDAMSNYSASLKIAIEFNQVDNIGIRLLNIGELYLEMENFKDSGYYLNESLKIFEKMNNKKMIDLVKSKLDFLNETQSEITT